MNVGMHECSRQIDKQDTWTYLFGEQADYLLVAPTNQPTPQEHIKNTPASLQGSAREANLPRRLANCFSLSHKLMSCVRLVDNRGRLKFQRTWSLMTVFSQFDRRSAASTACFADSCLQLVTLYVASVRCWTGYRQSSFESIKCYVAIYKQIVLADRSFRSCYIEYYYPNIYIYIYIYSNKLFVQYIYIDISTLFKQLNSKLLNRQIGTLDYLDIFYKATSRFQNKVQLALE